MKRVRHRGRRAALLGVLACAAFAEAGARRASGDTKVSEVLASWRDAPTDDATLEASLAALGVAAEQELARVVDERAAETEAGDGPPIAPVARALARVAGPRSVASLGRLARSARGFERAAAVAALATVPTEASLTVVLGALNGDSPEAAEAAVEVLPKLATRDPDPQGVSALVLALRDSPRPDLAARVLGRLRTNEAHEALLAMLRRNGLDQQSAALDGLWDGATAADLEAVRPFLAPARDVALRKSACMLLGRLKDPASVDELLALLGNEDKGLAANAHWALCEITEQHLGNDPELWTAWWEGGGSEKYGAASDGSEPTDAVSENLELPVAVAGDPSSSELPQEPSTEVADAPEDESEDAPPSLPPSGIPPVVSRSALALELLATAVLVGASATILHRRRRHAPPKEGDADAAPSISIGRWRVAATLPSATRKSAREQTHSGACVGPDGR